MAEWWESYQRTTAVTESAVADEGAAPNKLQLDPRGFRFRADAAIAAEKRRRGEVLTAFDSQPPTHQHAFFSGTHRGDQLHGHASGHQLAFVGKSTGKAGGAVERRPDVLVTHVAVLIRQAGIGHPRCGEKIFKSCMRCRRPGEDAQPITIPPLRSAHKACRE